MSAMFLTNIMPILAVVPRVRFLFHPHGPAEPVPRSARLRAARLADGLGLAMPAIILVTVWRFASFTSWWFPGRAADQSAEYYEAPRSTAGAVRRFRHLTLPLLMPVTFSCRGGRAPLARIFLMPFIITGGGRATRRACCPC